MARALHPSSSILFAALYGEYGCRLIDKATGQAHFVRVEGEARRLPYSVRHEALVVSYRAQILSIQSVNANRLVATAKERKTDNLLHCHQSSASQSSSTHHATISDIVCIDMAVTSPIVLKLCTAIFFLMSYERIVPWELKKNKFSYFCTSIVVNE